VLMVILLCRCCFSTDETAVIAGTGMQFTFINQL